MATLNFYGPLSVCINGVWLHLKFRNKNYNNILCPVWIFFPLSNLFSLFLMWQCWNKISWNFEIQTLWKDLSKTPVQSKACCVFYLLVCIWCTDHVWLAFYVWVELAWIPLQLPHSQIVSFSSWLPTWQEYHFCSTAWSDCTHLWAPRSSLLHPTWQRKWVMIICTSWTYFNTDCPTVNLTKFFNTVEPR